MRKFLFVLLLVLVSCAENNDTKPTPVNNKFLTIKQIEERLDNMEFNKTEEFMSDDIKERVSNLPKSEDILKGVKELVPNDNQVIDKTFMASSVDHREFDQPIVNQWNGTCTAHATSAMIETLSAMKYDKVVNISERDMWSKYKQYSAQAAMDAAYSNFIVPEKYWPHNSEKPKYNNHTKYGFAKISKAYYLGEDYKRLLFRMSQNESAKIAMAVPYSMANCDAVINPSSEPVEGAGHDIAISGVLISQKYGPIAIIKNSWGPDCGDHGYQYLPLSLCDDNNYYCYFWTAYELEFNK